MKKFIIGTFFLLIIAMAFLVPKAIIAYKTSKQTIQYSRIDKDRHANFDDLKGKYTPLDPSKTYHYRVTELVTLIGKMPFSVSEKIDTVSITAEADD